jgi:predicted MPP superfamily phosphohydrolase
MMRLPLVVVFTPLFSISLAAQQDAGRILAADHPLHLVAFGDFGDGSSNQAAVARAIAQQNAKQRYDLGITLGDNFYRCGVHSLTDRKWKSRWEDVYTPLGVPFYATLGNHDYGHPPIICPGDLGSPDVEVAYTGHSSSWRMPARYYTFKAGPVLFIAIDTEGWSDAQLKWIGETLAANAHDPEIKWRIVYGHHPIYTSGVHLNERRISVLREKLLPVLKAAHVDLYICGHDHDLEHLRAEGMNFLICGGGGAKLRHFRHQEAISVFTDVEHAFLDINIDADHLKAQYLNTNLKSLENPPLTLDRSTPY